MQGKHHWQVWLEDKSGNESILYDGWNSKDAHAIYRREHNRCARNKDDVSAHIGYLLEDKDEHATS